MEDIRLDNEIIKASVSDEDALTGELEVGSNNIDSLEVQSSRGGILGELESAGEVLTRFELELACFSEKLLNLDLLAMHVASRESDFEAFASEEGENSGDSAGNALEFDFLSRYLESQLEELDKFVLMLQVDIDNARGMINSYKHLSQAFQAVEEKILDCEETIKQSMEQVSEIKAQSEIFQRIISTSSGAEQSKDVYILENGGSSGLSPKIKMQTAEQQRHILRMFEKSLARELDLEKKLTDLRQSEVTLKVRLQEEVNSMEEEVEVVSEKLFESENLSEVLLGTSREMLSQIQILKFNFNGFVKREGDMRSKCEELIENLSKKDLDLQSSERRNADLKASAEKDEESQAEIHELQSLITSLKEQVSEAGKRAENSEAVNKSLNLTNVVLNDELNRVRSNLVSTAEKVNLLERQLSESDIKLQHAVATADASQEQQTMLYSTIMDMEKTIKDLKSLVVKAESRTNSSEEKCIILSETNEDLSEELTFLRGKVGNLEASLREAEQNKRVTATNIGIQTKFIMDLIMQLSMERERLHKQILLLTMEKKILSRSVPKSSKYSTRRVNEASLQTEISTSSQKVGASLQTEISTSSQKVGASLQTEISTSSQKHDKSEEEVVSVDAAPTSQLETVRDIDARQLNIKYVLAAFFVVFISGIVSSTFYKDPSFQF